jgi:hypothetical protein
LANKKCGIHELYADDPVTADEVVWGRQTNPITRRGFLTQSSLVAMSTVVGASIPFAHLMPGGLIPAAVAQSNQPFEIPGKEGLIILNDRPVNAETPAHLLDDEVTPAKYLFVRNNGTPPAAANIDPDKDRIMLKTKTRIISTIDLRSLRLDISLNSKAFASALFSRKLASKMTPFTSPTTVPTRMRAAIRRKSQFPVAHRSRR